MFELLAGFGVLAIGVVLAYVKGKRVAKDEEIEDMHNEYVATRNRMDAADRPDLTDRDVADSLRRHASKGKR